MTDQSKGIRSYGPGKFSTILDSYVYQVSLNGGCDEEEGSSDAGGWYGIMRQGRTIFRDHDPLLESLNDDEQAQLTSCAGVILYEDSQGFVYVDYFDNADLIETKWRAIVAEHEDEPDEYGESELTDADLEPEE